MNKCKKCKKNFNTLTKEGFCVICYKKVYGKWSLEYSNYTKDKKGNLVSKDKPMKFRKVKTKSKKKRKKRKKRKNIK